MGLLMVPCDCGGTEVGAIVDWRRHTMHRLQRYGVHQSRPDEPVNHT